MKWNLILVDTRAYNHIINVCGKNGNNHENWILPGAHKRPCPYQCPKAQCQAFEP